MDKPQLKLYTTAELVDEPALLEGWSAALQSDPHLDDQTPEQLAERVIVAPVIWIGPRAVAYSGLLRSHGRDGQVLQPHNGLIVVEAGAAYVHRDYRGRGFALWMMKERIRYARDHLARTHCVVCISTVPAIQHICRDRVGMKPIADDDLRKQLCWDCDGKIPGVTCDVCPFAPNGAWWLDG